MCYSRLDYVRSEEGFRAIANDGGDRCGTDGCVGWASIAIYTCVATVHGVHANFGGDVALAFATLARVLLFGGWVQARFVFRGK